MKEIQGKFSQAKIYTDVVDEKSLEQVQLLCDQPFTEGARIRMMPDIHAGAGCTIGTTMTITDKIVPNLVGVDIGCGMYAIQLEETSIDYAKLDDTIRACIPFGREVRTENHAYVKEIPLKELRCLRMVNDRRAQRSVGTLGGGNHFIEVDRDENNKLWLVIHSGSRYLGLQVANVYQEQAWQALNGVSVRDLREMIDRMKANGERKKIQKTIEKMRKRVVSEIPKDLAYLQGEDFEDYLHDMEIVQLYAVKNREAMADVIIREMHLTVADAFTTIHNYIDIPNRILRKGAVSAKLGETLLIPVNMRDGSLICRGKGNDDWNQSAPHGAGRLFSRKAAKEAFTVDEFTTSMQGIYTTSVCADTLDECPMVYKRMEDIVDNIGPTVDVLQVIKPEYNFKAAE
ncbi:MAG: RtcB family protein [Proteobacteria bacterium]|nr:RtcB family protein [Pseudomonadota bacterium]